MAIAICDDVSIHFGNGILRYPVLGSVCVGEETQREVKVMLFWSFIFSETYICYRGYFQLNFYVGKIVQKNFFMGLKVW